MLKSNLYPYLRRGAIALVAVGVAAQCHLALAAPSAVTKTKPMRLVRRESKKAVYARQYIDFALKSCDRVEAELPEITRVAEVVAQRHIDGGLLGFIGSYYGGSGLTSEMVGRSGGMVSTGYDRAWSKDRTEAQNANNMAIIGWDFGPWKDDLERIKKVQDKGEYVIGFGPLAVPGMAERAAACDKFFDTGLGTEGLVKLPDGRRVAQGNLLINMLHGWTFTGELVAACTRKGKMPTMWMSYMMPEGHAWGDKYLFKKQWHDDFQIDPIPAGKIARDYLDIMRRNIKLFAYTQLPQVEAAAKLIADERLAGREVVVATASHAPPSYVGFYEDKAWAKGIEVHDFVDYQVEGYKKQTPDGALALRLSYTGYTKREQEMFAAKKQRVIVVSTQNPEPDKQIPANLPNFIDMGWTYGDATVSIKNYPIRILPPSGIMQMIAYQTINAEVMARLPVNLPPVAPPAAPTAAATG